MLSNSDRPGQDTPGESNFPQPYGDACAELQAQPRRWLVTGVAGFIGSALLERLLELDQQVVGMDNLSTGTTRNLEDVTKRSSGRGSFEFHEADILDREECARAMKGVDVVLHQAALGSVPRSILDPLGTNAANITGFLNVIDVARELGVNRFVYAASSSTYGDSPRLPKVEDDIGSPLSPYAVTKYVNELYAGVYSRLHGMTTVGLRYFNVFGRRQDPEGAYAAVIPRWTLNLLRGESCVIHGDGETSRDFCYVDNVVQANILAATSASLSGSSVFNVACNHRTTLLGLFSMLRDEVARLVPEAAAAESKFSEPRPGDVRHSQADISRISSMLGYCVTHGVAEGLSRSVPWYHARVAAEESTA